jgi:hypothetical protein
MTMLRNKTKKVGDLDRKDRPCAEAQHSTVIIKLEASQVDQPEKILSIGLEKQVRHVISKPFNNKRPIKPPPSQLNLEAEIIDN